MESNEAEHIVGFIIGRIVADYLRLRRLRLAPEPETYASLFPEHAAQLLQEITLAEFRLQFEAGQTTSVESFCSQRNTLQNNSELILRLIEFELEHSETEPDAETVSRRFAHLDKERLTQIVEIVQLRREWQPSKKKSASPKPVPEKIQDTVILPQSGVQREVQSDAANTTDFAPSRQALHQVQTSGDAWTPEKSQTIQWQPNQEQDDIEGTLDYCGDATVTSAADSLVNSPAIEGTLDFTPSNVPKPDTKPAAALPTRQEPAPPKREFTISDSFAVENYIGSGRWKDVYRAKQNSTRQLVALKHLREKNDAERDSLVREVRTQALLTHQNIPPVFMLDMLPTGEAVVVEKLVDGSRWSDSIKTRVLDDNLRILLAVAQALSFAHREHQIIHRDLKPDNVVLNDKFGEVYLIDWGLAVNVSPIPPDSDEGVPHISMIGGVAGTPLYWAPELAGGKPSQCSTATDVFLLGALLYEILTGHPPYEFFNPAVPIVPSPEVGQMLRAVKAILIPLELWDSNRYIPTELAAIVRKATALNPSERYTDAGDFIDAVKQYQAVAIVTSRCEQNWKYLQALRKEHELESNSPDARLSLTLRFLETSDVFRSIISELQLYLLARDVDLQRENSGNQQHPTLLRAQQGEIESRSELIGLTLKSGDLTLAEAQIGLVTENPLHDSRQVGMMKDRVRVQKLSRRRAKLMKWVAVSLLAVFFGSSILYGYLINEQYHQTAVQHHRAEENYKRAEDNFRKAQSAVNEFFTTFAKDDAVKNSGLMTLRRNLLDSARKYHEDFVAQKSDDPNVIAGQVNALFDMAGIEANFGNRADAIDYYLKAIHLGDELVAKYPDNAQYIDILSKCYKDISVVYSEGGFDSGLILENNLKALALNRKQIVNHPEKPEYHRNLARILHNLGIWELRYGKNDKAEAYFRESLDIREQMLRFPDPPEYHYGKAQTHFTLGMSYLESYRFNEAHYEFATALDLLDKLQEIRANQFGNNEENLRGIFLIELGKLDFQEGKVSEALLLFRRSCKVFKMLVEKAPEHIGYEGRFNECQLMIFECLLKEGKTDELIELFKNRETELMEAGTMFPDAVKYLCQWYSRIAKVYLKKGDKEKAATVLETGIILLEDLGDQRTADETAILEDLRKQRAEISE